MPRLVVIIIGCLASACEAPLDLSKVEEERQASLRRYDANQAVAVSSDTLVVVASTGSVVTSNDAGISWDRRELPGSPSLIDVTSCPDGSFVALDTAKNLWERAAGSTSWTVSGIDTFEVVLSVTCSPSGQLYVGAGFGTILSRSPGGESWNQWSLDDDFQITEIDFVDKMTGFALGEFGVVLYTEDAGLTWTRKPDIPNEFYPMAADFSSETIGWVGGLDGVFWGTTDGGETWQRETSPTKAPIYGIASADDGTIAVGGSGTVIVRSESQWRLVKDVPPTLAYFRGIKPVSEDSFLIAGGAGSVFVLANGNGTGDENQP